MAPRVFLTRPIPEPGPGLLLSAFGELRRNDEDRSLSVEELKCGIEEADGVLCLLTDRIDEAILDSMKHCRIVANMAVGYNNIDVEHATKRGIFVTNTPGILTECTADLTWALILGVARRVAEGDREMRAGRFPGWGPLYMLGGDVTGATLGLIGPGRIATAVAKRAAGFSMKVLYSGRRANPELDGHGGTFVPLAQLLAESDFVSLHVPLTPETRHMINSATLRQMKPTAYLVNTSRGPVLNESELVEALRAGTIAGAALDVYEDEPAMKPGLAGCENALLLPHLGSATIATRSAMSRIAAQNLIAALNGTRPPNLVNDELWPSEAPTNLSN